MQTFLLRDVEEETPKLKKKTKTNPYIQVLDLIIQN